MKDYEYEAKIVRTDEANKVMDVIFSSPGRQDILCGVRLPESEADIGQTIHDAVPFGVWQEAERSVYVPMIGTVVKGVVRSGSLPALEGQDSPAIPFFSPAAQGSASPLAREPRADVAGFPTRYVADGGSPVGSEPEVTL